MAGDVTWAADTAAEMLEPLGRRWLHVQAVAKRAGELAMALLESRADADALVAAAYLHDIGYAPTIAATGFHPLDGARFVRESGRFELASLVAQHTGARNEALLRGISLLDEFPFTDSLKYRALTYCDLTRGPDGGPTNVDDRVAEICKRYGDTHVVSRAILMGVPEFKAIESEIEDLLLLNESPASALRGSR